MRTIIFCILTIIFNSFLLGSNTINKEEAEKKMKTVLCGRNEICKKRIMLTVKSMKGTEISDKLKKVCVDKNNEEIAVKRIFTGGLSMKDTTSIVKMQKNKLYLVGFSVYRFRNRAVAYLITCYDKEQSKAFIIGDSRRKDCKIDVSLKYIDGLGPYKK